MPRGEIPDPNDGVHGSGNHPPSVRGEDEIIDLASAPPELANDLLGLDVDYAD